MLSCYFIIFIHVGLSIKCTKWEKETLKFEIEYFNLRLWKNYGVCVALVIRCSSNFKEIVWETTPKRVRPQSAHMKTFGILRKQKPKIAPFFACLHTINKQKVWREGGYNLLTISMKYKDVFYITWWSHT